MEENQIRPFQGARSSRIWGGVVLLIGGFLLLAYKMGAPIPGWLFTWPVILIAIGLLTGIKSRFHNPGSFIMILIGVIFLLDRTIAGINFHDYLVPLILIGVGIVFIFRPKNHRCHGRRSDRFNRNNSNWSNEASSSGDPATQNNPGNFDDSEQINLQAVFGGIKRTITSKNFKGGEIMSFMGGSEINLMQADIQHPVVLEVNNIFGGTKLIIPSNWDVKNEISAVFGGVEDKRSFNNSVPDSNKKILLKGSCVFGGIEVTNY